MPTEHQEQAALMKWARVWERQHPELANLMAVPNGGLRNKITARTLQAEGVSPGFPDLFWFHPSPQGYHGLAIEMKRTTGGRVSAAQREWMARLQRAGYCAIVCRGWHDAAVTICQYAGWEEP